MIHVDYKDRRPIYEQIVDNVKKLAFSGAIGSGEKLPSVRSLAAELAINPNTIQRAYTQLESDGVVYNVVGKGCFVCADLGKIVGEKKDNILGEIRTLADEARQLGASSAELFEAVGGKEE